MRTQGSMLVAACTVAAALAWAGPAAALDFSVNSTRDRLDASPGDNLCATANGKCTLRAAISQANATSGTDQINLPKGTFELTRKTGSGTGNEEGDLDIDAPVDIDGRGARKTIIEQTVRDRVLESRVDSLSGAELTDLTLTGGRVVGPDAGGGVRNVGVLILDRVAVRGNAVLIRGTPNGYGGGVYQDSGLLLITDSTISRNTSGTGGGGVMAQGGLGIAITDSRISRNVAHLKSESYGGGILARAPAQVTNTTVSGNQARNDGGGIAVQTADGDLTLDSSTLNGNAARDGGGLHLNTTHDSEVLNSTFSGNSARRAGSAIYQDHTGKGILTHATIAQNTPAGGHAAVEASAFAGADSLDFYGSIIANKGLECGGELAAFAVDDQNVFGGASCASGMISTDRVANPQLRDLAANGGLTRTHALKAISPAIDFVNTGPSLPTDQRGEPREFQAADAGSFERQ